MEMETTKFQKEHLKKMKRMKLRKGQTLAQKLGKKGIKRW